MPVNILYCEGGPKSPDIRVLSIILAGACVLEPAGGKYGFGDRILGARKTRASDAIAGLGDRDFDDDDASPHGAPRDWQIDAGKTKLGWRWERKEIENYLIDPVVVAHALGSSAPNPAEYHASLQAAADAVADYTAARIALSLNRPRFTPLANSWGDESNLDGHRFPAQFTEEDCRHQIPALLQNHAQTQIPPPQDILRDYDRLLVACRVGGVRYQNFLTFFAGKDLLLGMQTALTRSGLGTARQFRERIIKGIEESSEEVWTWLPEWTQLRKLVRA